MGVGFAHPHCLWYGAAMRYFLAYLLPEPARSYHQSLSSELASAFRRPLVSARIQPHLTLKAPFETEDEAQVEEIVSIVRAFAQKETPEPAILRDVGHFNYRSLFYAVSAPKQTHMLVRRLQDRLRNVAWLPFFANEFPITLHATLVYTKHPQQGKAMLSYLAKKQLPEFPLALDHIALLRKSDDSWHEQERWVFGE